MAPQKQAPDVGKKLALAKANHTLNQKAEKSDTSTLKKRTRVTNEAPDLQQQATLYNCSTSR